MKKYEVTVKNNITTWKLDGNFHDGPNGEAAISYKSGYKAYYKHGKLHNENGPAIIYSNGDVKYWVDGKLHNENGPAVMYSNGDVEYWIDGKLHDGPNGESAISEESGYKVHYKHGKYHNENGPAIIYSNGIVEYYIDGKKLTKEEFENRNKSCIDKIVKIDGVKYQLKKV